MSNLFHIKVTTAKEVFFDEKVVFACVEGPDGQIGVMAHHEPAVIAVRPGMIRLQKKDGEWFKANVDGGFLTVSHNRASLLVYSAERL